MLYKIQSNVDTKLKTNDSHSFKPLADTRHRSDHLDVFNKTGALFAKFTKTPCLRDSNTKNRLKHRFFCEFCKVFKNTFFNRKSPVAASATSEWLNKSI